MFDLFNDLSFLSLVVPLYDSKRIFKKKIYQFYNPEYINYPPTRKIKLLLSNVMPSSPRRYKKLRES